MVAKSEPVCHLDSRNLESARDRAGNRDQAWAIRSYPCTGLGTFLYPFLPLSSAYTACLQTLRAGGSFLDIGCFIGHDMRRFVFDGAPSERLYGIDIVSHWDVGYNLFRDRGRFDAQFLESDILHPSAELLTTAQGLGGFDVVAISLVLHQWDRDEQVAALKQVVGLTGPRGTVVGFQVGNIPAKVQPNKNYGGKPQLWHDLDGFRGLWGEVSAQTGTRWECEVVWRTWEECGCAPTDVAYLGEDARMMGWVARRKE